MASKAIHLKRGVQHIYINVDQLFEAAFGRTEREYRYKSLMGWRPLEPESSPEPLPADGKTNSGQQRSPASQQGVTVYETDEIVIVEIELPAIVEDSLYLEISGDLLIISGHRLSHRAGNRPDAHRQAAQLVYRHIHLPVIARPGQVRARLEGDTVRVMIYKTDEHENLAK